MTYNGGGDEAPLPRSEWGDCCARPGARWQRLLPAPRTAPSDRGNGRVAWCRGRKAGIAPRPRPQAKQVHNVQPVRRQGRSVRRLGPHRRWASRYRVRLSMSPKTRHERGQGTNSSPSGGAVQCRCRPLHRLPPRRCTAAAPLPSDGAHSTNTCVSCTRGPASRMGQQALSLRRLGVRGGRGCGVGGNA
ncbi:hypothetical protein FB451DRAFT_102666 [Mycena latifolia]|nr:hypothetical protein FB451DRAFT_102666 [Mycena latifolia]